MARQSATVLLSACNMADAQVFWRRVEKWVFDHLAKIATAHHLEIYKRWYETSFAKELSPFMPGRVFESQ